MRYFDESLAIAHAIGDRQGQGTVLNNVAVQAYNLGDYPQARDLLQQVLAIARGIDDLTGVYIGLMNLAGVESHNGHTAEALALYDEAQRYAEEAGDRPLTGYIFNGKGRALLDGGQPEAAQAWLRRARDLRLELGQTHMAAESRAFLAEALAAGGELPAAAAEAGEALAYLEAGQLEDMEDELRVLLALYRALDATGDPRAPDVLTRAYNALAVAAARLDKASRARYLADVPWNRAIVRLWEERAAST
jgi:tetratricopeptide (TPR) repeat protein